MKIISVIAEPLGKILLFIYDNFAFHSYGLALIIFTIMIKLVLLPLMIKQYKSTLMMQELQPQIQEMQKKFKNDKTKLNEAMMKFYQEKKYNPASGCLPVILQMPILFALFMVVSKPITYVLQMGDKVNLLATAMNINVNTGYIETKILNGITNNVAINVLHIQSLAHRLLEMKSHMVFLGINLGLVPSYKPADLFGPLWKQYLLLLLIPILSTVSTFVSSKLTVPQSVGGEGMGNQMQKNMLLLGPVMTLIFSFQFPAGLGLYWTIGYIFQIFQQLFFMKVLRKNDEEVATVAKNNNKS